MATAASSTMGSAPGYDDGVVVFFFQPRGILDMPAAGVDESEEDSKEADASRKRFERFFDDSDMDLGHSLQATRGRSHQSKGFLI